MSFDPIAEQLAGSPVSRLRARVRLLVEHRYFQNTILALIVISAVVLGMETSGRLMAIAGTGFDVFDRIVVVVFVVELLLRIFAHGLRFFRDPWNLFDFVVVSVTLVPATDALLVLRSLRVLRVLRLVSAIPRLRRIVAALLHAVPGVASVCSLLAIVFYVFSVISTKLFGSAFPDWFGTIGESMYSLFQIMTLESWSMGLVRPVMEVYPWAWVVFVTFIMLSSFTVLNVFIAIIIDSMQTMHRYENEQTVADVGGIVHDEHRMRSEEYLELKRDLIEIKQMLQQRESEAHKA